jgi:hypothetical protein
MLDEGGGRGYCEKESHSDWSWCSALLLKERLDSCVSGLRSGGVGERCTWMGRPSRSVGSQVAGGGMWDASGRGVGGGASWLSGCSCLMSPREGGNVS